MLYAVGIRFGIIQVWFDIISIEDMLATYVFMNWDFYFYFSFSYLNELHNQLFYR